MRWLEKNWFKVGLLVPIVIVCFSIAYYYFYSTPKINGKQKIVFVKDVSAKGNLELQAMCSKKADEYFKQYWEDNSNGFPKYDYFCHYNQKLNKCFVKVVGSMIFPRKSGHNEEMVLV